MTLLTKTQILTADDLPTERVPVPEWGGEVNVCGLTGTERDAYEAEILDDTAKDRRSRYHNLRAKLVARTVVDDARIRVFSDDDIDALGRKSGVALNRVFEVAQRLSGLGAQDVEELVGNSDAAPADGSTSASPKPSA